ncbi:MAG: response regulator, partial [bacterium]
MPKILIVDDDPQLCNILRNLLEHQGHQIETAETMTAANSVMDEALFDLVVTDLMLPDGSGIDIIKKISSTTPDTSVIMLTGHGSVDTAVDALKLGAADYITKPFNNDELLTTIDRALEAGRLRAEVKHLRRAFQESFNFDSIIGNSIALKKLIDVVKQVAPQDINVLIQGESGTGKELFAKAIHNNSPRATSKFVAINCSAMPDLLLESELFGHVRGAFTSA